MRGGQRIATISDTAQLHFETYAPGTDGMCHISELAEGYVKSVHDVVKIGDVVTVIVEVIELVPKGRQVRLHCEALVDNALVLDGEAIVSVPARPKEAALGGPGLT